jgi:Na+-translocating ferredoxin:NAD+ oxidoreductase RnfE subunit
MRDWFIVVVMKGCSPESSVGVKLEN